MDKLASASHEDKRDKRDKRDSETAVSLRNAWYLLAIKLSLAQKRLEQRRRHLELSSRSDVLGPSLLYCYRGSRCLLISDETR
jgi:hypothetical protein